MKFLELNHAIQVLGATADLYDGGGAVNHTTPIKLSEYDHACFFVTHGVGTTATATYTVEACDDNVGTNPVAIPFTYRQCATPLTADIWGAPVNAAAAGFTVVAGSNQLTAIEVDARELLQAGQGKTFVRVTFTEVVDGGGVTGSVFAVLNKPRHGLQVPLTALS